MDNNHSEKDLVARAKHCPEAFGWLYDQNYSAILNYCIRRTGDVELAQDITAETFVKALKNIGRYEWRGSSFSAWLYRIAGNELTSYYRKGANKTVSLEYLRESQGFDPSSQAELEEELIAAEEQLARFQEFLSCRQKISQLPIKYQEVITLRFFACRSLKDIAEILGKPEGTTKSLLHRGLKKLRRFF
ncbi:MAG: RNA polymerase sigma factor [Dethiobacter sp.]|jgi:RNA polymerase sigma-70 factor (ECF subfamily)|nr:RNA polymerase sigma factor [Dethiobacter sp.]MBS3900957.1 RNA polymerase sigma factor [Dethiobacter sp.]MBS3988552.1 RNA polymerase sigma factor [Dethiobacter sp.]